MKIAIASSGLGHIRRGVETWAAEIAGALRSAGEDVTLFQGGGEPVDPAWNVVLPCIRRYDPRAARLARLLRPLGAWKFGMGSPFPVEQTTFSLALWRRIRRDYDILHVKEPWIALWLDRLNRRGLSRPRVVISHGTEESFDVLARFSAIQHMAPCYVDDYQPHSPPGQLNFVVPNFVDMAKFPPGDRAAARREWGLPQDSLVFLCVAAIKKTHKRIDYLVREFHRFAELTGAAATLVVAGAREPETDEVMALGRELLGERIVFLENVPRARMLTVYQAADVFVLTSLHEMFGNVFLEAMSAGVPVICNDTPTLRYVIGRGGLLADLSQPGALAAELAKMTDGGLRRSLGASGTLHVRECFSHTVVIPQMIEMYRRILSRPR